MFQSEYARKLNWLKRQFQRKVPRKRTFRFNFAVARPVRGAGCNGSAGGRGREPIIRTEAS